MFIGLVLSTIILSLWIAWLWGRRDIYKLSWELNGPFALPLLGNIFLFLNHEEILKTFEKIFLKFDGPIRMWLGAELYVLLNDPQDIGTVLTSPHCLSKADIYNYAKTVMSTDGLVTNEGTIWRQHRKLIAQGFSLNTVNEYLPMFNKNIKLLVEHLSIHVGKDSIDLKPIVNLHLMNSILETTLGHDIDNDDKGSYEDFFSISQHAVSRKIYLPWHRIPLYWYMTKWPGLIKKFNILHNNIFDKLIESRYEHGYERLTLLDKLLRVHDEDPNFTLNDVKGECNTIMMAGSDTSAISATLTLFFLAMYPDYQKKVYNELSYVIGDKKRDITREDLDKLQITECCILESMRMIPIVPIIARKNRKPILLKNNVTLPVGTQIAVVVNRIHHDPNIWGDDASIFRAERFLPQNYENIHSHAFLGFSSGPRNCIGYKYAMAIVKMSIASLILNYKLTTSLKLEDVHTSVDINVRFLTKLMVQIHER